MSQLNGKWLENDTVKENHILTRNDQPLRSRNNADTLNLNVLKLLNALDKPEFLIQPQFAGAPVDNEDLANKAYVLAVMAGLRDPKDAVRAASTANIDLAAMPADVDGVTLNVDDRFAPKNQTLPEENGIYLFKGVGNPAIRATDADEDSEVNQGMSFLVSEGVVNARKLYALSTPNPIVVGTTPLTFVQAPNPANFLVPRNQIVNVDATIEADGYFDLPHSIEDQSIILTPVGGPQQLYNSDFTLSVVGNVTRVTFAGNLATLIEDGDVLQVKYSYATA